MSHYTKMTVECQQKNEQDLVGALKAQFGESVEVYNEAKPLRLWNGGAATRDSGYGTAENCHIIVRREAQSEKAGRNVLSNDAGYRRNDKGTYDVFVDEAGFPKTLQNAVMRDYTERVAARKMKAQGYAMKRTTLDDGRIQLRFEKYT